MAQEVPVRAIGYIRASKATQILSPEAQKQQITRYAKFRGMDLKGFFSDGGECGFMAFGERDGGARAMDFLVKQKRARHIVMTSFDRGFRNLLDWNATMARWQKSGIVLHFTNMGGNAIDFSTAIGEFIGNMLAATAQYQIMLLRENTQAALMELKRQNLRYSRHAPFGWQFVRDGFNERNGVKRPRYRVAEEPREQKILAAILSMREGGMSYPGIAQTLNDGGEELAPRSAKEWNKKAVSRLIARHDPSLRGSGPVG